MTRNDSRANPRSARAVSRPSPPVGLAATVAASVLLAISTSSLAAEAQPLFAEESTIALTLEAPFSTIRTKRHDEPELAGTLRYADANGSERLLTIFLRPRGNTRLDICTYPPLRIDFRQADTRGSLFEGQRTLKLVRHCGRSSSYRSYVGREYQTYRAYNALTERSFRVRWLEVEYVDTNGKDAPYTAPAFFIEEDWAMAERLGMALSERTALDPSALEPLDNAVAAIFQYMIGNADWSATNPEVAGEPCCHNGVTLIVPETAGNETMPSLSSGPTAGATPVGTAGAADQTIGANGAHAPSLESGETTATTAVKSGSAGSASSEPSSAQRLVVVPYDFDQAGLINARYATHNLALGLRKTERRYRGSCALNDALDAAIEHILAAREAVANQFASEHTDEKSQRTPMAYIDKSFERISDSDTVAKSFVRYCRR